MNTLDIKKILVSRSKIKQSFELTVEGSSMLPILHHGEHIQVCAKNDYTIGDIVVFFYKNDNLLVHRLLKIENGRYFCKGDNSFCLEDVERTAILGAVIQEIDENNTLEFISASYSINRVFRRCGYNVAKTKLTPEYISFYKKYINI